jgi:NAD(P)H-dependent FMN reductase
MSEALKIVMLIGTVRAERLTERAAKFVVAQVAAQFPDVELFVHDVRDFHFPMDDDGTAIGNLNAGYQKDMAAADALLIVSPEYNHSFPGTLKRALDCLFDEYKHKAVGVVGVSNGMFGGVRVAESLLPVVRTLGLVSIKPDHYFPKAQDALSEEGVATDPILAESFGRFMKELTWMARVLREGRKA